jgi:hypothetical protein
MKRVARHAIPAILLPAVSCLSVASFDAMGLDALIFLNCVGAVSLTVGLLTLSHTLRFARCSTAPDHTGAHAERGGR